MNKNTPFWRGLFTKSLLFAVTLLITISCGQVMPPVGGELPAIGGLVSVAADEPQMVLNENGILVRPAVSAYAGEVIESKTVEYFGVSD